MLTVVLAGGSGLIGTRLSECLTESGYHVRILTRSPQTADHYHWDPYKGTIDSRVFDNAHAVINLAGSGIADRRWTASRKKDLIDSRVKSIELLYSAMSALEKKPEVFVSASAVGIYGDSGDTWLTEATPISQAPNRGFMVECCDLWEKAADRVATLGIRTVKIRVGIVLAPNGGALKEIIKPIRFGLATYFGNGKAWYPWIHLTDIARLFIWGIENPQAEGVYNGVAPQPARNYELTMATVEAMRASALPVPVPKLALRLILGEMSAVVLNSNRVSAEKLSQAGFNFLYPDVNSALRQFWP